MHMRRILRAILPWMTSGGISLVILVLVIHAFATQSKSEAQEIGQERGMLEAAFQTIEQGIVSALSMVPTGKTSSPLVAAIIENHLDARLYQRGLTEAIAVFEMIVEGDITRFLAIYRADDLPGHIGPLRSLRLHFLQVSSIYRPLFLHIGGNSLAYDMLRAHPELTHHDGIRYDGKTYRREPSIPAPHNLFIDAGSLRGVLEETKGLREIPLPLFPLRSTIPEGAKNASEITVDLRSPIHTITFTYDAFEKRYQRSIEGAPRQSYPANILVLETEIEGYGTPGAIPWTKTFGKGRLLFATRGKMTEGTWAREEEGAFDLTDRNGNALPFSRGQTWIILIPNLRSVEAK